MTWEFPKNRGPTIDPTYGRVPFEGTPTKSAPSYGNSHMMSQPWSLASVSVEASAR